SGGMSSTDVPGGAATGKPDIGDVNVPGGTTGSTSTGTGAGTGMGTNPGPTAISNIPSGIPISGAGASVLPSPGSTGQASPSATAGNFTNGQMAGAGASDTAIPDWLIPLVGGMEMITGAPGAAYDSSAPVLLPNGTVIPGGGTLKGTITAITDYSRPITKGVVFNVNGTVAQVDGTPVAGMIVDLYLARDKASPDWISCGRTVAVDGRFAAKCEAPDDVPPGDYNLIARSLDNLVYRGSDSDPVVSLVSPTSLSIDAPGSVRSGEGCVVNVALTESVTGLPLTGQPVDVSIGSYSASGATDDRGIVTVKSESLPDGTLAIVATYPGRDGYLASTIQRDITVAPLNMPGLFLYGLLALVILLALAAIVFVAYTAWGKRRGLLDRLSHHESPAEAEHVRMEAYAPHPASPYVISFPVIEPLLPAVWGTGEELAVHVTGIPGKPVSLALDDQILLDLTMENGETTVPLILEKGNHRLSVVPATGGESLATAGIRIVDYREEVVRLFNDLYHRASLQFKAATELATPREFLWTVRRQMPDASDRHLDRVITIFEVANYSLHGIGRDDYVKSYLSIKELAL
ncbi:MAG: Ig-like domain-containing protein, partial [Betaproteobacteria bacterium]